MCISAINLHFSMPGLRQQRHDTSDPLLSYVG